jgi:hypothetical protein
MISKIAPTLMYTLVSFLVRSEAFTLTRRSQAAV